MAASRLCVTLRLKPNPTVHRVRLLRIGGRISSILEGCQGSATPSGSSGDWVRQTGGIARLNHRLLFGKPSVCPNGRRDEFFRRGCSQFYSAASPAELHSPASFLVWTLFCSVFMGYAPGATEIGCSIIAVVTELDMQPKRAVHKPRSLSPPVEKR